MISVDPRAARSDRTIVLDPTHSERLSAKDRIETVRGRHDLTLSLVNLLKPWAVFVMRWLHEQRSVHPRSSCCMDGRLKTSLAGESRH